MTLLISRIQKKTVYVIIDVKIHSSKEDQISNYISTNVLQPL